jgi:hypothetical protein
LPFSKFSLLLHNLTLCPNLQYLIFQILIIYEKFPNFQISKFPNFQISKFPNFQISKFFKQKFFVSCKFLLMFFYAQSVSGQIYSPFTEIQPIDTEICPRNNANRYPVGINIQCPTSPFHVGSESTFEGISRFNAPVRFMEKIELGSFFNYPELAAFQISNIDANGQTTTIFKTNRWGGRFVWQRNDSQEPQIKIVEFGGATGNNHYFQLFDEFNNDDPVTEFNTRGTSFIGTKLRVGNIGNEGGFTLAVGGKIGAKEEVRVFMSNVWNFPDYVFEPDYNLPKLADIEAYVQKHKHLPEVPSAKEVEKDGMSLNEMNIILLKKVEELTLYAIDQEKRIKALETENTKLKDLEKRLQALETQKP